ncbi:MAG: sulfoxide reductase heme-binding subunit YedZ [Deltaproteobacteria bacterium]|nr:sulfoxide reductase heme-binding subunit YedZ [Deltaproteobacteria bacterium]
MNLVKSAAFIALLLPLVWLVCQALTTGLGANPVEKVIHTTGDWALNILLITLSITPLKRIIRWKGLLNLRRMVGLYAFFYATLHLMSYIGLDQSFSWEAIMEDVIKHNRIWVGLTAYILLIPLAVTSTNRMVQRLGIRRWKALHNLIYLTTAGGVIHYLLLVKRDMRRPMVYASILIVLLGYRLVVRRFNQR